MQQRAWSTGAGKMTGVAVAAAVLFTASLQAQAPAENGLQGRDVLAVKDLVRRFAGAEAQFQPDLLRTLLTDDYQEVSPIGDVDSRDKVLGFYAPENRVEVLDDEIAEAEVRVSGDTAVEIARIVFEFKLPDGTTHRSNMRATFVARRVGSGWRLASAQYTEIPAAATNRPQQPQPVKPAAPALPAAPQPDLPAAPAPNSDESSI